MILYSHFNHSFNASTCVLPSTIAMISCLAMICLPCMLCKFMCSFAFLVLAYLHYYSFIKRKVKTLEIFKNNWVFSGLSLFLIASVGKIVDSCSMEISNAYGFNLNFIGCHGFCFNTIVDLLCLKSWSHSLHNLTLRIEFEVNWIFHI